MVPHAERNALAACTEDPRGATLYVTLEPCCHHGKQPPCTEAILAAGIAHVVVGSDDPNPLVAGKGIRQLRENGVTVTEHCLQGECDRLNEVFFHYIQTKRPFVVLKYAMTLDGKIAAPTGASQWITGEAARNHVQQQRHRYRGIMVGVGTVLTDNPRLTCRLPGGRSPTRIICDTHLRTPMNANVVTTARETPTILATCCTDPERQRPYEEAGCQVLCVEEQDGHVNLPQLMERLGEMQLDSILLEGGGTLNGRRWRAASSKKVQQAHIAPNAAGGRNRQDPGGGDRRSRTRPGVLPAAKNHQLGEDFLIESEVADRSRALLKSWAPSSTSRGQHSRRPDHQAKTVLNTPSWATASPSTASA